jgi:hypothetical protein
MSEKAQKAAEAADGAKGAEAPTVTIPEEALAALARSKRPEQGQSAREVGMNCAAELAQSTSVEPGVRLAAVEILLGIRR